MVSTYEYNGLSRQNVSCPLRNPFVSGENFPWQSQSLLVFTIRSHGTRSHILGRKLHSGSSKPKAAQRFVLEVLLCRTNLKQFTTLYQGPKMWNSLPISITSSSSFFTFKTKMLQFLSIKSWIEQAALTHFLFINDSRGGLCYKPSGFLRSPRHYCKFYYSFSFYFNNANN